MWNRNFFLLWQGQAVSQLGGQAFTIAIMYWLMEQTGSSSSMGLFMMCLAIPTLLLTPFAGTWVDRFNKRNVLIVTDLIRGILMCSFAACFWLFPDDSSLLLGLLLATTLVANICAMFFHPAASALVPQLVEKDKLVQANSALMVTNQVSAMLGQSLGGIIYKVVGAPLLFLFDGISYLISALTETRIHTDETRSNRENSQPAFWQELSMGLQYVKRQSGLIPILMLATVINLFMMPLILLLPFFTKEVLNSDAMGYGFLLSAMAAGALITSLVTSVKPIGQQWRSRALFVAPLIMACALFTLAHITQLWLGMAVISFVGVGMCVFNALFMASIQEKTADAYRGRVMSIVITLSGIASPIGLGLSGWIGEHISSELIFQVCGVTLGAIVLLASTRHSLHAFARPQPDPVA